MFTGWGQPDGSGKGAFFSERGTPFWVPNITRIIPKGSYPMKEVKIATKKSI